MTDVSGEIIPGTRPFVAEDTSVRESPTPAKPLESSAPTPVGVRVDSSSLGSSDSMPEYQSFRPDVQPQSPQATAPLVDAKIPLGLTEAPVVAPSSQVQVPQSFTQAESGMGLTPMTSVNTTPEIAPVQKGFGARINRLLGRS